MSAAFVGRRLSLAVGWRLAAGLLPTLLAIALVIGLFYYGEIGRAAPRFILFAASALTVLALGIALMNARYFVDRFARLSRVTGGRAEGSEDEFDRIEHVVGKLGTALSASEAERTRAGAAAAAQLHDQATMLAGVVADTLSRLDEVRLPLHILLEAPFGTLNENQEELLRDARAASDAMDAALRRLAQVADADRGALAVQPELVQINDVVRSVLPLARAAAERRGARVDTSLEPGLHRVMADRARLAQALTLLASEAAETVDQQTPLSVGTARDGTGAMILLSPVPPSDSVSSISASRLIAAQGGTVAMTDGSLELRVGQTPTRSSAS